MSNETLEPADPRGFLSVDQVRSDLLQHVDRELLLSFYVALLVEVDAKTPEEHATMNGQIDGILGRVDDQGARATLQDQSEKIRTSEGSNLDTKLYLCNMLAQVE